MPSALPSKPATCFFSFLFIGLALIGFVVVQPKLATIVLPLANQSLSSGWRNEWKILANACAPEFAGVKLVFNSSYGLCTTARGEPIIWTFWDYTKMPVFARISIPTLRCHNDRFARVIVANDSSFRAFMRAANRSIHPAFDYLHYTHRSDYARCMLLLHYGGLYTDLDVVAWNSTKAWFDRLRVNNDDFAAIEYPGYKFGTGSLMGPARANHVIFQRWRTKVHAIFDTKMDRLRGGDDYRGWSSQKPGKYPIGWHEILFYALAPIVEELLNTSSIRYYTIPFHETVGFLTDNFEGYWWAPPNDEKEKKLKELSTLTTPMFRVRFAFVGNITVGEFLNSSALLARIYCESMTRCSWHDYAFEMLSTPLLVEL